MHSPSATPAKILIIRFSSLGDIVQSLTAVDHLAHHFAQAEIHWVTREDFAELVSTHPGLKKVWSFRRQDGLKGLVQLAKTLRAEGFTHVYDAHSNVRSHLVSWILRTPGSGLTTELSPMCGHLKSGVSNGI